MLPVGMGDRDPGARAWGNPRACGGVSATRSTTATCEIAQRADASERVEMTSQGVANRQGYEAAPILNRGEDAVHGAISAAPLPESAPSKLQLVAP